MAERFTSPVGRFVQGDFFTPQTTDQQGAPRVIKTGPNAGQPNPQFYAGLAIRKDDPNWPAFWAMLDRVARLEWPALFPNPGAGCVNPKFAFKVLDGDGHDTNGKSNATKEGFAGHWVVRFTSSFQPKCFHAGRYAPQDQIQDPHAIRRGYYVRINGSVKGNGNQQNPGLFLNFDLVELAGYGEEITSGPDATEAFGAAGPVALPPGASATPVLPAGGPPAGPGPGGPAPASYAPPAAPAAPAPASYAPPAAPPAPPAYAAPPMPPGPPAAPAAPAYAAPPAPPAAAPPPPPPAPPAAPQRVMTATAPGTYEALLAAGWTDALLIQHGHMLP